MGGVLMKLEAFVCLFGNISSTNCSFLKVLFDREICWYERFIANRIFSGVCFIGKALILLQNLVLSESLLSPDKECVWIGSLCWSPCGQKEITSSLLTFGKGTLSDIRDNKLMNNRLS